jgi:hypothetical protein
MRALIHVIETVAEGEADENSGSGGAGDGRRGAVTAAAAPALTPYDRALRREQRERARPLLRDLRRLANYVALTDGYVRADPTPERMADTLQRLEREAFGRAILDGPRRCWMRLGEPMDLADRYAAYRQNKRAEVARLTRDVEACVAALLSARSGGGRTDDTAAALARSEAT